MKGFRTVIANASAFLAVLVPGLVGVDLSPWLGPEGAAIIAGLALANLVFRAITSTPVFNDGTQKTNG